MTEIQNVMTKYRLAQTPNPSILMPFRLMAEQISQFETCNAMTLRNWQAGATRPIIWKDRLKNLATKQEAGWVQSWAADMLAALQHARGVEVGGGE